MSTNNYKQYKKAKKEKNLAEKGQITGAALAGTGGLILGGREYIKHLDKQVKNLPTPTPDQVRRAEQAGYRIISPGHVTPEVLKKAKPVGIGLAVGGSALGGYSTIKAQRAKRKLKELTEDDNKKK